MPYKRILIPYDGSSAADKAVEHAMGLARELKRSPELVLLNVVETIILPPRIEDTVSSVEEEPVGPEAIRKQMYLSLKSHAKAMLSRKVRDVSEAGLRPRTAVRYGYAADEIVKFAKEEKTDLVIMGNVGLRGLSKLRVLGSVSRSVAEKSACPVTIVH